MKTSEANLKKQQKSLNLVSPHTHTQKFFLRVLSLLHVRHCCKLSLHAISREKHDTNSIKWLKRTHFGPDLGPLGPNSGH